MLRFLVLDAYPRQDREALVALGGKLGGERYVEVLQHLEPGCVTDLIYPADSEEPLAQGAALTDYDGIVWSGSTLTVHEEHDVRVRRTIDFARAGFESGVPSYGSCYAAQVAVVAAGGTCVRNPRGREIGAVHDIALTDAGRHHPLFARRPAVGTFSVFQSHQDVIDTLPKGAEVLAENAQSPVQGVAVQHRGGSFWAVQYHPEWTYDEVADVFELRDEALVREGVFESLDVARDTLLDFRRIAASSEDAEDSSPHVADELLDLDQRVAEARSWIDACVKPHRAGSRSEAV
ncbi:MAG: type 1 glutamine amidotransferase [Acidobacteriota bacterium]